MVLIWDKFSDGFWSMGLNWKNLWFENFVGHPLNSINGCPMASRATPFARLDLGAEGMSLIRC